MNQDAYFSQRRRTAIMWVEQFAKYPGDVTAKNALFALGRYVGALELARAQADQVNTQTVYADQIAIAVEIFHHIVGHSAFNTTEDTAAMFTEISTLFNQLNVSNGAPV